jgi:hypothetical protein
MDKVTDTGKGKHKTAFFRVWLSAKLFLSLGRGDIFDANPGSGQKTFSDISCECSWPI